MRSVKYLHKYFFKLPDLASIKIAEQNPQQPQNNSDDADGVNHGERQLHYNEDEHYLNTRYTSATEPCWH